MSPLSSSSSSSEFNSPEIVNSILNSAPSKAQQIAFNDFKLKETKIIEETDRLRFNLSLIDLNRSCLFNQIIQLKLLSSEGSWQRDKYQELYLQKTELEQKIQQKEEELLSHQDRHQKFYRKLEIIDHRQQLYNKLLNLTTNA